MTALLWGPPAAIDPFRLSFHANRWVLT
jgi:hypothetical protein